MTPNISLVIRTRSTTPEILAVLRRIGEQTTLPLETIVIDSGSSPDLVDQFRNRPNTKLIEIPPESYTSAGALNRACSEAKGELIAILSQDALPADAHYLESLAVAFEDPKVAGAYGRQIPREHDHPLNIKDLTKTYPPQSRTQTTDGWFDNCCSMIRSELWRRHPFDESMVISEDQAWGKWAIQNGYALRYEAEARVVHSHDRTMSWLWDRFYHEGIGLARIHGTHMTLWQAWFGASHAIIGDYVWLACNGYFLWCAASLFDRPVKYAALWAGYRKGRKQVQN